MLVWMLVMLGLVRSKHFRFRGVSILHDDSYRPAIRSFTCRSTYLIGDQCRASVILVGDREGKLGRCQTKAGRAKGEIGFEKFREVCQAVGGRFAHRPKSASCDLQTHLALPTLAERDLDVATSGLRKATQKQPRAVSSADSADGLHRRTLPFVS